MAGVCARARVWAAWGYSEGSVVAWRSLSLGAALSLGARHVVLRALRTGIFVLSKKYAASTLTLDVVAELEMDGWRWVFIRRGVF